MKLAWYWWTLIGLVVIIGGYAKLRILKNMMKNRSEKKKEDIEDF